MAPNPHTTRLAILDGGCGVEMGPDLMYRHLEEGYDTGPDNIALICTHQSWGYLRNIVGEEPVAGCLTWTYRRMMRAARDLALVWEEYGIKRGDTLVAFLPSCAELALGFWIAAILELTFVPIDPTSLAVDSPGEHEYPLELLETSVVLVSNIKDAYNFDDLYPDTTQKMKAKIVCHERIDTFFRGWINFEPQETYRLHGSGAGDKPFRPSPEDRVVADNRVAVVLFTQESPKHSPKGCPLTVLNIRSALANQSTPLQQTYLVTCPPWSSAALEVMLVAWKRGSAVVFPGVVFSAQMTLSATELYGCTRLVCTPPHLEELTKHPSRSRRDLSSLENLSVYGGAMSADLLAQGQEALQIEWASSSFMMAEAFGALVWRSKLLSSTDRTLESVGTVLGGSHVKICSVNGKDHSVLRRGEEGRLHVGGEGVIQEYLSGASKECFYQDTAGNRWFITNYLATMDTDDLVRLTTELKVCFQTSTPCAVSL
jgi:acyl-CoA synthetase (AMP-forming)/AMP-acid ligase II